MDLLRSLIVPPALLGGLTNSLSDYPRHSYYTAVTSSADSLPPASPVAPTVHTITPHESAGALTKNQKKKQRKQKQKQSQTNLDHRRAIVAPIPSSPAGVTKASKRKRNHFFHPDRPTARANKPTMVSYEDLYDDISAQQQRPAPQASPAQPPSKSNPESTQTCFFWYHGSCKRSRDKEGCQLRHALLDPPGMVVAPPRFVHPRPCELEWCAGDGPRKAQKAPRPRVGTEQKRYFEVPVSDGTPVLETAGNTAENELEYFLSGFEEPTAG